MAAQVQHQSTPLLANTGVLVFHKFKSVTGVKSQTILADRLGIDVWGRSYWWLIGRYASTGMGSKAA